MVEKARGNEEREKREDWEREHTEKRKRQKDTWPERPPLCLELSKSDPAM